MSIMVIIRSSDVHAFVSWQQPHLDQLTSTRVVSPHLCGVIFCPEVSRAREAFFFQPIFIAIVPPPFSIQKVKIFISLMHVLLNYPNEILLLPKVRMYLIFPCWLPARVDCLLTQRIAHWNVTKVNLKTGMIFNLNLTLWHQTLMTACQTR